MLQSMSQPPQKAGMEAQLLTVGLAVVFFAMQQQAQTQSPFCDPNVAQQQPDHINTNLFTFPPDAHELSLPPLEIQLPHNATVTPSQFTNTDPSYQRKP
ncbi:MAG: hypothetical protein NXY57DRAFT_957802 [Lentinula lateritia]|nr:MAG: hypothetical protein NXY57DRAFT_957802 [Lentinula lateritia]